MRTQFMALVVAWMLLEVSILFPSIGAATPIPVYPIDPGTDVGNPPRPGQWRGYDLFPRNELVGWFFEVLKPLPVTHFAWYDQDGDGLSHEHRIGLWRIGYEGPLREVTIPPGTEAELAGVWRRVETPGPILQRGDYYIGGTDAADSTDVGKYIVNLPLRFPHDSRVGLPFVGWRDDGVFAPPTIGLLGHTLT